MTIAIPLPRQLDRDVLILADRETVFRFFTDPERWAAWWGAGSTIDARPGGRMIIRYPNALEAHGEVLHVRPPDEILFTLTDSSRRLARHDSTAGRRLGDAVAFDAADGHRNQSPRRSRGAGVDRQPCHPSRRRSEEKPRVYRDQVGLPLQTTFDEFAVLGHGGTTVMLQQITRKSSGSSTGLASFAEIVLESPDVFASYRSMRARGIEFRHEPFAATTDGT
jgi:uncharacterized protein YndB with AHSA1/START domain